MAAWDTQLLGGNSVSCGVVSDFPGDGGAAAQLLGSELFLSGGVVRGGAGGNDDDFGFFPGSGGDGMVADAASRALLTDSPVSGGPGGTSILGGPSGPAGSAFSGQGMVRMLPGAAELRVSRRFVLGQSVHPLTVEGKPGLEAVLYITRRAPFLFDSIFNAGSLPGISSAPPLSTTRIPLGTIPANGILNTSFGVPAMPTTSTTTRFDFVIVTGNGPFRHMLGNASPVLAVNCDTVAPDCNGNGRGDLCEFVDATAVDLDNNGIPDECDVDCNGNGVPDTFDISSGGSMDLNQDGIPDECQQSGTTWFVDATAAMGGAGTFASPFRAIGEAFAVALTDDDVVLMDGVYDKPTDRNIDFNGRGIRVRSMNGPGACTIDLQDQGRAFFFAGAPSNGGVVIEGLRIINGNATVGLPAGSEGGAIHAAGRFTIQRCVFENNRSSDGGAVYAAASFSSENASISRCMFLRNGQAPGTGRGGALSVDGFVTVDSCIFEDNVSVASGGAIDAIGFMTEPVTISRCVFRGNSAGQRGGALFLGGALGPQQTPVHYIDQCLFNGNSATGGGAIAGIGDGTARVTNCTMFGNTAINRGGAIAARFNSDFELANCIVRGNTGAMGDQLAVEGGGSTLAVVSSNIDGGASAISISNGGSLTMFASNVDADPLFVDADGADNDPLSFGDNNFRLSAGSPSVDAGSNEEIADDRADVDGDGDSTEPVELDLVGNPRRVDDPATPDTGTGTAPIVDHGPFER